ncbi:MAG: leucine-rich repeat domain-containing protein [Potamolinea sp.]
MLHKSQSKGIVLSLALSLVFGNPVVTSAAQPKTNTTFTTFAEWCVNKADLPVATQITVDAILGRFKTRDCNQAQKKLSALTKFDLSNTGISDLRPLSGQKNLTALWLAGNKISDLSPVSGLTKLKGISLMGNQVSDLRPLSNLTNLAVLYLSWNKIRDVTPLSRLNSLTNLLLEGNQIRDARPLSSLTNLTVLNLKSNPLANKTCPVEAKLPCWI